MIEWRHRGELYIRGDAVVSLEFDRSERVADYERCRCNPPSNQVVRISPGAHQLKGPNTGAGMLCIVRKKK